MMDPMFYDYGHDENGNLKSAFAIHENFLRKGKNWTVFGDFRYESFNIEQPSGSLAEIQKSATRNDMIMMGLYSKKDWENL